MMDNNNRRHPSQGGGGGGGGFSSGGEAAPVIEDWRKHLPPESRRRIVNKIMENLKKHIPMVPGQEGLQDLRKIAVRFEEKNFNAAMSQSDYLRKISLKMLIMETKTQNTVANSEPSNSSANSSVPPDPDMQPQLQNQSPSTADPVMGNQSEVRQQLLSHSIQSSLPPSGAQGSAGLTSTLTSLSGINQTSLPTSLNQNTNMQQDMPNVSLNSLGTPTGRGSLASSHMFMNQRQVQGRQQPQNQQQYLYQQQLENHLLKQKLQQGNMSQSSQSQPPQQSVMQPMGIKSAALTDLQQNQHPILQTLQPRLQQHQQPAIRHHSQSLQQKQMPQFQLPPAQQQLMSQMQPQPGQLGQQQQASLQRDLQKRLQASNPLLQSTQNVMDQQRQLYQSQRGLAEPSSVPLDSTAESGHANGGDWQEEAYQKIKSLKELYLADLKEMWQKIAIKFRQRDSLPQQPNSEQVDKLKIFKTAMERCITILQLSKNQIHPDLKDKLPMYEKHILNIINNIRPRRQQGQLPLHHMSSMQPQQLQVPQIQSNDYQMINPQSPSTNLQGSVASLQQNNSSSTQHGPMINSLQSNPIMESARNILLSNSNNLQENPNILQQNVKQRQEQQIQQEFRQQNEQQQMQCQMQRMQKQQLTQQQQFRQQTKQQQQQLSDQPQAHQISQMHQMNDVKETKIRPGMGLKQETAFKQHHPSTGQRPAYPEQLKPAGSSFPTSSPQLLQAGSPQIPEHSSPQVRTASPLHSASSHFVAMSPATPLVPSPLPADSESQKPASGMPSLSSAGNLGHQHTAIAPSGAQSLAIGTPGISASPLLPESSGPDGVRGVSSRAMSGKSTVIEQPIDQPIERLIRAVKSASPQALSDAVHDMSSVVSLIDRVACSAPGDGSRAAFGEDLMAMTKCHMQGRNFVMQDGPSGAKKMRRRISAIPLNVASSAGSANDSFKQLMDVDSPDLESTATSGIKRLSEVNYTIIEEIREINRRLVDTVVDICDEDVDPTDGGVGVIVKCSYNAVSLSPGLKSPYGSPQLSPIQPLRMLIPSNYPNCSPVLLDEFPVEVRDYEDLSSKAMSKFSIYIRGLSQPVSLKDMARTWDSCSRAVILEYAEKNGGGSFSSIYGTWEKFMIAT